MTTTNQTPGTRDADEARSVYARDPGDCRWYRHGDDAIGVVQSDRDEGLWAPAYVADGAPAGEGTLYRWDDLEGAVGDAARITARHATSAAGGDARAAYHAGRVAERAAEVRS